MTRVSRTRSRVLSVCGPGHYDRYSGSTYLDTVTVGPYENTREDCSDRVGPPWVDSTLSIKRSQFPQVHLSGQRGPTGGVTYKYYSVPLWTTTFAYGRTPWVYFNRTPLSNTALSAMAIANANPNRPVADLPVSLVELRELPGLLRDAGRIAMNLPNARRTAKANLMAQFGVMPIINDVATILNFAEQVSKREHYLRKLNSGKPVKIKRRIAKEAWVSSANATCWNSNVEPSALYNTMTIRAEAKREYWYSVRGNLSVALSEREIQSLAFKTAFGLGPIKVKQLWELLPWSWLIDWFSTTGDILAAYRTGIPWSWHGLCVMHRTDYKIMGSFPAIRPTYTVDITNPQGWATVKERTPVPSVWPLPSLSVPYLTGGQWSILASLATLRL
jgi:hypothetical protein